MEVKTESILARNSDEDREHCRILPDRRRGGTHADRSHRSPAALHADLFSSSDFGARPLFEWLVPFTSLDYMLR